MIRAAFIVDKTKGTLTMSVRGHSGLGARGRDLVCAGASTLAYTAAQNIDFMAKAGQLDSEPKIIIHEGHMKVQCKPKPEHYAEALHTFFVVQAGMLLLAKNFPKNIELKPFETA